LHAETYPSFSDDELKAISVSAFDVNSGDWTTRRTA